MEYQYGLYAYGITDQYSGMPDTLGLDSRHKVYPLVWKDLCVLVSEIDIEQFQKQIKDVIAELAKTTHPPQHGAIQIIEDHEKIIDNIMQENTVVPLKFGTILKDEDAARQMLMEQEAQLRELLARFAGKVEWGLKVYADRQELIKHLELEQASSAGMENKTASLSKGTAYLLGKKKEEELKNNVINQFALIAQDIFHTLADDAFEAKITSSRLQKEGGREKDIILNTVFLVEKEKVPHLQQQREVLIKKYAFVKPEFEFSGPWPPYNFT